MRVLLVEDNLKLAVAIGERLERAGFGLDRVGTIQYASSALEAYPYSVVLLDRRLPDGDGLSLVPSIRRLQPASFILVLTALDAIDDRIEGLDGGADDYLTKPFSFDEMLARVRAGLRRPGRERTPPVRIGALSLDLIERTAFVGDCPVSFLRRELALLVALMTRAGCVVSRKSPHRRCLRDGRGRAGLRFESVGSTCSPTLGGTRRGRRNPFRNEASAI